MTERLDRNLAATHARFRKRPFKNPRTADSSPYRIKITDFGLARHIVDGESLAMTDAGALLGTPHYMAPEQWTGRSVDARTDVYAMGATLYHLLAGQTARSPVRPATCFASSIAMSLLRLSRDLTPGVSEAVARAVERALAKSPDDRFADAAAMLRDLEALRLGKPTDLAIHPRLPELRSRQAPSIRIPLGAGIVAATALAVRHQHRSPRPSARLSAGDLPDPL